MWWTGVILGFFLGLIITQSFGGALLFAIIGGFVGFAISKSQARKRGHIEPGAKGSPYFSAPESELDSREPKSLKSQFLDLQRDMQNMQRRMAELEQQLFDSVSASESEKRAEPARPEKVAVSAAKTMPPAVKTLHAPPSEKKTEAPIPAVPPVTAVPPASPVPPGPSVPPRSTLPPRPTAAKRPAKPPKRPAPPTLPSHLREFIRRFVIGGNPLVKIGVLILFLGLGFALRYAADYGLLPLWFRYVGVAAVGVAMLVFGWRWRGREDNYGLIVQGGGIGVLYLTTLAAMKLHPLLPMGFGFAILVVVAAFAAFLAVMQDAVILAVVAALGGFAAPVLASTGSGNHIALFSYLTVLNLGIVGIAWFKSWRVLNIIGYVCSFGLGSTWAVQYYRDELFWTTEPFLLLLFGLYVLITVLFARRTLADAPDNSGESLGAQVRQASPQVRYVDGSLAFGVPFSAFWVQHLLVEPYQYGAAISAAGFGAFYFLLAYLLFKRTSKRYALLTETLVALGAVFSTLAIPLLETPWTAAAYAVEAAGVYWIGIRQRQMHVRVFALLVLVGSAIYFLPELRFSAAGAVLDGPVLSAVLLTVSTGFTYWLMWRTKPEQLHVYETELRPYVIGFGGLMLATIPMLLFRLEWASPALAILGAALIFASMRMPDRFVLRAGLILQFVGGALFLTTLDNGTGVSVLDGSLVGAVLLTVSTGVTYWLMWRAEPEQLHDFEARLRPFIVGFAAIMLATIPMLLLSMEWASPALALLGTALIFASTRMADRSLLHAGWIFQLIGGALFLTTLDSGTAGSVLANGWLGLLATCLVGTAMVVGVWAVAPDVLTRNADDDTGSRTTLAAPASGALLAGLAFINLAPLFILSWRLSAMIWPAIGIGTLVWAVRTRQKAVILFALGLQVIAGLAHMRTRAFGDVVPSVSENATAFLNSGFLGPVIIALAAMVCARLMHKGERKKDFEIGLGWIAIGWGGLWWAFAWYAEITRVAPAASVSAALVAVTLATALAWSTLSRRLDWQQLGQAVFVYLPLLVLLAAVANLGESPHPLAGWGALVWPAALLVHGLLLRRQKEDLAPRLLDYAHTLGAWLFIVQASLELRWWLLEWLDVASAWSLISGMFVPALYVWALTRSKVQSWWPVRDHFNPYVMTSAFPLIVYLLGWLWLTNLTSNGNAQPLAYMPVLNPLELGYVAVLISVGLWWRLVRSRERLDNLTPVAYAILGGTAFAALTGGVTRACHHWANIPWDTGALVHSYTVQTSLSVVWGVLAISLMLLGNRRHNRTIWITGAALVAVVVVKLFLVELAASGTLQRIVSFIGVGLMLLFVGYVAPLPPRKNEAASAPRSTNSV